MCRIKLRDGTNDDTSGGVYLAHRMASINEGGDVVALVRRNALHEGLGENKPWYLMYLYKFQHCSCDFIDCVPESTKSCDIYVENASHTTKHVYAIMGNKIVRMRLPRISYDISPKNENYVIM